MFKDKQMKPMRRFCGDDWPDDGFGATMIGTARLLNVATLLHAVMNEGVAGAFAELGVIQVAERSHRRDTGEALTKPLYPTTFLIHGNQNIGTLGPNIADQRIKLGRIIVIAAEQDQRTGTGVT